MDPRSVVAGVYAPDFYASKFATNPYRSGEFMSTPATPRRNLSDICRCRPHEIDRCERYDHLRHTHSTTEVKRSQAKFFEVVEADGMYVNHVSSPVVPAIADVLCQYWLHIYERTESSCRATAGRCK
jgi:fructose-1,6-bisphosphatase/sedoheptulose 1,7-bisphosphatase-like protein